MSRRPGRNDPCPCGSGKKFKHCCIRKQGEPALLPTPAKQRGSDPDEALKVMRLLSKAARAFGGADCIPTTPVEVSEPIRELCATLAPGQTPVFVPVTEEPHARFGECCENVQTVVSEKGGILRSGWTIWERPNFLLCAERHACWDRDGACSTLRPSPTKKRGFCFFPTIPRGTDFRRRTRLSPCRISPTFSRWSKPSNDRVSRKPHVPCNCD